MPGGNRFGSSDQSVGFEPVYDNGSEPLATNGPLDLQGQSPAFLGIGSVHVRQRRLSPVHRSAFLPKEKEDIHGFA